MEKNNSYSKRINLFINPKYSYINLRKQYIQSCVDLQKKKRKLVISGYLKPCTKFSVNKSL